MKELCIKSVCTADWICSTKGKILRVKWNQAHNIKAVSSANIRNYLITQTELFVHNGKTDSACISLLLEGQDSSNPSRPCGIMYRRCCLLATSPVHYTASCKQSSAPEDGRNYRPKHVELIVIINKICYCCI